MVAGAKLEIKICKHICILFVFKQIDKVMGLFRTLLLGAAAYGAYKYVTKKDVNGRSMVDDIKDKAPEWKENIKRFKDDIERKFQTNDEI